MRSGKNRFAVEIFSRNIADDGTMTYTSQGITNANIQPLTGREQFLAQQNEASTTHRLTIRYRPGITPDMFVAVQGDFNGDFDFGDKIFGIISVIDKNYRHRELELLCSEVIRGAN